MRGGPCLGTLSPPRDPAEEGSIDLFELDLAHELEVDEDQAASAATGLPKDGLMPAMVCESIDIYLILSASIQDVQERQTFRIIKHSVVTVDRLTVTAMNAITVRTYHNFHLDENEFEHEAWKLPAFLTVFGLCQLERCTTSILPVSTSAEHEVHKQEGLCNLAECSVPKADE